MERLENAGYWLAAIIGAIAGYCYDGPGFAFIFAIAGPIVYGAFLLTLFVVGSFFAGCPMLVKLLLSVIVFAIALVFLTCWTALLFSVVFLVLSLISGLIARVRGN
jgi:hypothetical protein